MPDLTIKEVDLGVRTFQMTGNAEDGYFQNIQAFVSEHPELLNYARAHLAIDSICLDVGANIGVTTLQMCALCPQGHVFAFEPSPLHAAFLRENLRINDITNCTVINLGLGAELSTIPFHVDGASSHFVTDAHLDKDRRTTIPISVMTLDEFMTSHDAPKRIDFIKIDAEGFEPGVLVGAAQAIARYRPPIFMEFNAWCLYFFHRYDPYTFATALWDAFLVYSVGSNGELVPTADGDVRLFLAHNLVQHSCVDDVVLQLKPGKRMPPFSTLVDPVADLRREVADLRRELAQMKASRSWKITAPLRAAAAAARRLRSR